MRLYYTGASPNNIRKARQHAPSHCHGYGWTHAKMTPHDTPYFLDNGAYTGDFDGKAWIESVHTALRDMPTPPDFIVMPDVFGDAEATMERHERWLSNDADAGTIPPVGDLRLYWVLQPGVPLTAQFDAIRPNFYGVFVGGPKRWKRAYGREIVDMAHERDLRAHVGNPGGSDGLVWAYRAGFDSCDTTTVFQNGYWHYLDKLERATERTSCSAPDEPNAKQATLTGV